MVKSNAPNIDQDSNKHQLHRAIARIHRWLGLLLAVQITLWIASGVVMSWFHSDLVNGKINTKTNFPIELNANNFIAPGGIIAQNPGTIDVQITTFLGNPVYIATTHQNKNIYNALTGEKLTPLKQDVIHKIAYSDYAGNSDIAFSRFLTTAPKEYQGDLPIWQVQYSDSLKTRLYISPNDGKVKARRNKVWRIYDFFWMLHIMDYETRDNYNNPLIKAFSLTALLFVLSGIMLVIFRLRSGRYWRDIAKSPTQKAR